VAEFITLDMEDQVDHCESFNAGTAPIRRKRNRVTAIFFG